MINTKAFFTSESVTEGHPDKMCDVISDAILDAILTQDTMGRVACETCTGIDHGKPWIRVFGEVKYSGATLDYEKIIRRVALQVGYINESMGLDARTCDVQISLTKQSPEIDSGVSRSLEAREGSKDNLDLIGAGDQGMMIGFACDETPEYMPLPISLAHRLVSHLSKVRNNALKAKDHNAMNYLRPVGKSQVTVQYEKGRPVRVDTVVISTQHAPEVTETKIRNDVIEQIIKPVIPNYLLDKNTKFFVNPAGRFVMGGPTADSGLTGRKIIVDTYGGMSRHGGGAFSGKDPTKVDRTGAYIARYVAKNLVAAGIANRIELQIAYAIGVAHPLALYVDTFGTEKISNKKIIQLINEYFDLRPAAVIQALDLKRPLYEATAAFGHFGRIEIDAPWEKLDKVSELNQAAKIKKSK